MMMRPILLVILLAVGCPAWAQQSWLATTSDFTTQTVRLRNITAQAVVAVAEQNQKELQFSWDNLLQLQRPAIVRPAVTGFLLQLVNGDRLTGQPTGYADEQLQWQHPLLGQMRLPLKEIRAMLRGGQRSFRPEQTNTEDIIALVNGDTIKGLVTSITDRFVTVSTNAGDVPAPLENVQWISLAPAGKAPSNAGRKYRLSLADGSILTVTSVQTTGDTLSFGGSPGQVRQLSLASIQGLEQVNGPVSWLSSQQPAAMVQRPFFGALSWPAVMDATVSNHPIQFAGRTYARGIGVHAYSRLDYALDGSHRAFRTQYAIATDITNQLADLTVRILVDDKVVHVRQHVNAQKLSEVVVIQLPDQARQLSLEVDFGQGNDVQGHLNWIEPALLRQSPPATAPAAANKAP